jgi:hypothetical protein
LIIASKGIPCIYQEVLALITLLDGANAAMFHVEHCGNRKWQYQIRWPLSRAAEYQEWSAVREAAGEKALEPLMDPTVITEVRWRWADVPPDGEVFPEEPWQDAVPHEWGESKAWFHVILKQPRDFRVDPLVHAAGRVRAHPIAFELTMPARLAAQSGKEAFTVSGRALGFGPASVLREAGEFVSANDAFSISNAGGSQVTLLPVPPRVPAALPFLGTVAVKVGRLTDEEIELLRAHVRSGECGVRSAELEEENR